MIQPQFCATFNAKTRVVFYTFHVKSQVRTLNLSEIILRASAQLVHINKKTDL